MAAVTAVTIRPVLPGIEQRVFFYRYTKAGATDTYESSGEFTVVRGVFARSGAGATDDPATISSNTLITLSAGTGASYAIVVGDGS